MSEVDWDKRMRLEDESSLLEWYPLVKNVILTPKTVILPLSPGDLRVIHKVLCNSMDGIRDALPSEMIERIQKGGREIGYPLFLRSDQGSGKHDWESTCYVESEADLIGHVLNLHGWHTLHNVVGLRYSALVFREFIPLWYGFKAFDGMPVARERRYFVRDGKVECHHPYWVKESIRGRDLPDEWETILDDLNREYPREIEYLTGLAELFGYANPGYWSVDFAFGADGKWYLIDAARGEVSWHQDGCPYK